MWFFPSLQQTFYISNSISWNKKSRIPYSMFRQMCNFELVSVNVVSELTSSLRWFFLLFLCLFIRPWRANLKIFNFL